eukprot:3044687-Rhodomonas_salina.2
MRQHRENQCQYSEEEKEDERRSRKGSGASMQSMTCSTTDKCASVVGMSIRMQKGKQTQTAGAVRQHPGSQCQQQHVYSESEAAYRGGHSVKESA